MAAAPPPKNSLVAIVTLSVGQDCGCEELRRCFLQIVDAVPRLHGELTELNSMFQSLDTNEDGQLSLEEIVDGMEGRFTLLREEVEQLVEAADLNLDGEPPLPSPAALEDGSSAVVTPTVAEGCAPPALFWCGDSTGKDAGSSLMIP